MIHLLKPTSMLILKSNQAELLANAATNLANQQLDLFSGLALAELTNTELLRGVKSIISNIEKNEELIERLNHIVNLQPTLLKVNDLTNNFYVVLSDYYNELDVRMLDIETTPSDRIAFADFIGDISRRLIEKAAAIAPPPQHYLQEDDELKKYL